MDDNLSKNQKSTRILVVGYYYHNNIGDDQYIDVFKYMFASNNNKYKLKFVDCDKLSEISVKKSDIVIIGGGDILNNYFLDKIISVFKEKSNKIIAVSVGMPYLDILINTQKLQIIDYIFIRTKQEREILGQFYCHDRIFYLPDLSFFMKGITVIESAPRRLYSPPFCSAKFVQSWRTLTKKETLLEENGNFDTIQSILLKLRRGQKKIVVFSLNRHIYSRETAENYRAIVKEIASVVQCLLLRQIYVCFLPFNTTDFIPTTDNLENDIIIHNDVYHEVSKILSTEYTRNIIHIQTRLSTKETFELYQYFDFAVVMRFHATLFSVYNQIPFIPIYTTKKIRNLLLDINYIPFLKCELEVDQNDLPTKIDGAILKRKLVYLMDNAELANKTRETLSRACEEFKYNLSKTIPHLLYMINTAYEKKMTIQSNQNDYIIRNLFTKISEFIGDDGDFRNVVDPEKRRIITSIVSFYLTGGDLHSDYCYGFEEKMFSVDAESGEKYDYLKEWEWVINDHLLKGGRSSVKLIRGLAAVSSPPLVHSNTKLFDIHYFNQENRSDVHRAGWNYVYNELKKYSIDIDTLDVDINSVEGISSSLSLSSTTSPTSPPSSVPLLDLYVDRTFHWEKEALKAIGIIPYRKKWRGFIHHTFDTEFSDFNNAKLLKTPEFLESLPFCEMIYVLSKTLETQLRTELAKLGGAAWAVKVTYLTHPTEIDGVPQFKYISFLENPEKRILHVGGWLRNTVSFYQLRIPDHIKISSNKATYRILEGVGIKPTTTIYFKKTALLNINGANYHPHKGVKRAIFAGLKSLENSRFEHKMKNVCGVGVEGVDENRLFNNWNKHIYNFFDELVEGVEKVGKLTNHDYDELLTKNIVFLHLVDGSAINTLNECIVRNTPIIVNKHPSTVELLGEKYPLFYEDYSSEESASKTYFEINKQMDAFFKDPTIIHKAYKYLSSLDKTPFRIETFKEGFFQTFEP